MYRKRLNKKLRRKLNQYWIPTVFPTVLLMFGPFPTQDDFDNWVGRATEKSIYRGKVQEWFMRNYIDADSINHRTGIEVNAFVAEYEKWVNKQTGE